MEIDSKPYARLIAALRGVGLFNDRFASNGPALVGIAACCRVEENEAQLATLEKLAQFGWRCTKLVYSVEEHKCAFGLQAKDSAAWLLPNGELERAPLNRRTARLPGNWKETA